MFEPPPRFDPESPRRLLKVDAGIAKAPRAGPLGALRLVCGHVFREQRMVERGDGRHPLDGVGPGFLFRGEAESAEAEAGGKEKDEDELRG